PEQFDRLQQHRLASGERNAGKSLRRAASGRQHQGLRDLLLHRHHAQITSEAPCLPPPSITPALAKPAGAGTLMRAAAFLFAQTFHGGPMSSLNFVILSDARRSGATKRKSNPGPQQSRFWIVGVGRTPGMLASEIVPQAFSQGTDGQLGWSRPFKACIDPIS